MDIIPSILTSSANELRELVSRAENVVKKIHIDIIDGVFASNKTVDPSALENIDTTLQIDFHLMVDEPVNWVEKCLRAGANRVLAQVEMMGKVEDFIVKCQETGVSPGLAIDLDTPIDTIEPWILKDVDAVLVMSVKAGFGGQEFNAKALEKIRKLNKIRAKDKTPFKILDDGGITTEIITDLEEVRVDEVVIGQRIFQGDLGKNINAYKKL